MDQNVRLDAQAGFATLLGFDEKKPGRGVGAVLDKSQTLRLKARADKRDALKKQLSDAEIGLDTAGSKLRMLREMERDYEGFSKAVKLVMQEAARGALRGVHGPVSALIHTDDAFTTAIETALGAAMQNIVVDSDNDGKGNHTEPVCLQLRLR